MSKIKCSDTARLHTFILKFGEEVFSTAGIVIICKICGVKIASEKNFTLKQHIASGKHVRALQVYNARKLKIRQQHKYLSQTQKNHRSMKNLVKYSCKLI